MNESETVEFKASASDFSGIAHTICAFANTKGGAIYIGINDKGKAVGVIDADEIQKRLSDLTKNFRPVPFHSITVEKRDSEEVIIISIKAMAKEICFYQGRVWIRSGSTNHLLEGSILVNFIREKNIISFEDSSSTASIEDIDFNKISEYFALRGIKNPEAETIITLKNLRMIDNDKIKNLAVLFFAKEIEKFFPYSSVRMVKFKGIEPVNIVNADFVTGTLIDLINRSFLFIKSNTSVEYEIKDIRRIEKEEFPFLAYREAIINAIGHRDFFDQNTIQISIFDDRMEITNPGKLPITIKDLGKLAVHRNPNLYNMLMAAKFVEGVGTGIPRMTSEMRLHGLADPVFEEISGAFRVTLYNKKGTEYFALSAKEKQTLDLVKTKSIVTASEIAKELKVSVTSALSYLKELQDIGYVKKQGATRGSKFFLNL